MPFTIINRKQKSVSTYYLKHSRLPWLYISCEKRNTHGVILFHWLFIGIERLRFSSGPDEVSIVWNWGVHPIQKAQ